MALNPGSRLGPYEVVALLGSGGMGEVYKARDTRLDRVVAVKVLSPTMAADPGFRERFNREARTISQLDHPHICALHDVGEHEGTAFLVLQYLEGETLERRLQQGPLKLDEALRIGIQVADALDRAHRAGIVHRDLKPGNVMLTKSGAKLLDFGLAKTTAVLAAEGATMMPTSPNLTAQGAILGTLQYMAPEQLEGREADARTDLFAFGALMYEMVTRRKAFEAKSHASLIAAILEREPMAITTLLPVAPAALDHIVGKCLAKDPEDRWQSARDVMTELKWISVESVGASSAAPAPSSIPVRSANVRAAVIAAVGILIGAALAFVGLGRLGRGPNTYVSRVLVAASPAERLQAVPTDWTNNEGRPSRTAMAWSPDGRSIAFTGVQGGKQHLYLRTLDQLEATIVAGTEGATNPFFSPDGRWVGFQGSNALKKIAVAGGPPTVICDAPGRVFGASWGSDDSIVYSQGREGLWRVPAAGGTPQRLTQVQKGELKHLLPQILPGSQAVLYTITQTAQPKWDDTQVVVQSLSTGERKVLVESGADGRYAASGHLLYLQRGTLMAAPFDVKKTQITGGAIGVVADVMQAANTTSEVSESGAGQFAVSQSGSLLYLPGGVSLDPERSMAWVDRSGAVQPLPAPVRAYMSPRLSPDGTRVAVWTQGDRNVWIYELSRNVLTRVASEGRNARPIWTPDGQRLTYGSATVGDENVVWKAVDGGGAAETLMTCNCLSVAGGWAPDGRALVLAQQDAASTLGSLQLLSLAGDRRLSPLTDRRFFAAYPDISPDGHWMAYAADDSGRREVYVQSFPQPGARHQVSTNGGSAPAWSRDGRELFYVTAETLGGQAALTAMMSVPVKAGRTFDAGAPRKLFEGRFGLTSIIRGYDVSSDSRRFLMVQQKDRPPTVASHMILVENWFDELRRKVPVK